jgi:arsenate reductase
MKQKPKVLFFSTGNATRSRMAEVFLEELTKGEVDAESTAVKSVSVNPAAVEVMKEIGIDITKHHAKPVHASLKEHFSCVITLSDDTMERSPIWPFTRNLVHWNLPDPDASEGSTEQQREVLRQVRDAIADKVDEFAHELTSDREELAVAHR